MINTPEQFIVFTMTGIKTLEGLTTSTFAKLEKLAELNLTASKSLTTELFSHIQSVAAAKDPQELLALQVGTSQALAEKAAAYGNFFYSLVSESRAELTSAIDTHIAETRKGFAAWVEEFANKAPVGSASAAALFKSVVTASQDAIDAARGSAKQAADAMDTNFKAVSEKAMKAPTVSRKV